MAATASNRAPRSLGSFIMKYTHFLVLGKRRSSKSERHSELFKYSSAMRRVL